MRRLLVVLATSVWVVTLLPSLTEARQHPSRRQLVAEGRYPVGSRCGASRPTRIHAFTVKAEWDKRVFTSKETAAITLTVTRPAPEDPLGLGIPTDPPI